MISEPIIDIIVYGYPKFLPTSIHKYAYATTDYNGHIHFFANDTETNVYTTTDIEFVVGLHLLAETNAYNINDVTPKTLLSAPIESYISLLDTRLYYDWLKDSDEKWSDNPVITNGNYIRGAGSIFGIHYGANIDTSVQVETSMNAYVGIFYDWTTDADETWADDPDVTNQDYLQTKIA